MRRILIIAGLLAGAWPVHARCTAFLLAGPLKVRPYAALPQAGSARLVCARNEYCSFQVVVTAEGEGCRGLKVEAGPFSNAPRDSIPARNVTLYRQAFMHVFYPSSPRGATGEWPDPLIPDVDLEYGEPRRAFPVDLSLVSPAYKKYAESQGRAVTRDRGDGVAIPRGLYTGAAVTRYVVQIVRPGPIGQASFRWWTDAAPAKSPELPVSRQAAALSQGLRIAFHGMGTPRDFLPGDEFWFYAGPQRRQPVWVDVLIPASASPGVFRGHVRVTAAGQSPVSLPVEMEVLPVTLPATPTLVTAFGFTWTGVARGHYAAPTDAQVTELGQAYARAALRHGITLISGNGLAPRYEFHADGSVKSADYSRYDAAVAPLLDARGAPGGARWTSLRLPQFPNLSERQFVSAVRHFAAHARQRGWYDRLFDYTFDEPNSPRDFAALEQRARLVREADPDIPRLATTQLNADWLGLVTRWCPVVNSLGSAPPGWLDRLRGRGFPGRYAYAARLKAGDSLWWYQSCLSHGCAGRAPPENWPSYVIDSTAVANRVIGILSVVPYRVSGMLYWDTVFSHHYDPGSRGPRLDPWEGQLHFGGNGEGSFFYPGRPEQIGGKRHFPVESLRLKMIRDSLVDAELALQLERLGDAAFVREEAGRIAAGATTWSDHPQAWLAFRERLARRLAQRGPSPLL